MSEMIKRVEHAVCRARMESDSDEFIARAAIAAMNPPTEGMIAKAAATPGMQAASGAMALHQARGYRFDPADFENGSPLHQAWQAMIDEALA